MIPCAVCGRPSDPIVCSSCGPKIRPLPRKAATMPNWHYWPTNWADLVIPAIEHEADRVAELAGVVALELGLDPEAAGAYVGHVKARVFELWDPRYVVRPEYRERAAALITRNTERAELIARRSPTGLTYTGLI